MRTPAWCRKKAAEIGPACAALIAGLLEDNALCRLRAAQGVLHLGRQPSARPPRGRLREGRRRQRPVLPDHQGILAAGKARWSWQNPGQRASSCLRHPLVTLHRLELGTIWPSGGQVRRSVRCGRGGFFIQGVPHSRKQIVWNQRYHPGHDRNQ
jgi:hypothetical protein